MGAKRYAGRPVSAAASIEFVSGKALRTVTVHASTKLGRDVKIYGIELVNIYGATIGDETRIGPFVEIQAGAVIGVRCKIQSHTFIPEGVTIEDEVFVGHGVMFTNDLWPRAVDGLGEMIGSSGWTLSRTLVRRRAVIGSGVTLLPVEVGAGALIGAGTVVTKDVPAFAIVTGNPGRVVGDVRDRRPALLEDVAQIKGSRE